MRIMHTSEEERGQIYIPQINWLLFALTSAIVLGFRSSGNLAGAYGVAVTTTMVITTLLTFFVMRDLWKWSMATAFLTAGFLFFIDISYFSANMLKVWNGGWLPLMVAAIVYLLMSTWIAGRDVLAKQLKEYVQPLKKFLEGLDLRTLKKVPGTAVYMTESPLSTPPAFVHNINHNKVLHRRIIFIYIGVKNTPHVRAEDRVKVRKLPRDAYMTIVRYGFMDRTDMRAIMRIMDNKHLKIDMEDTTFFVGRDTLIPSRSVGLSKWRDWLYLLMRQNSARATKYFNIPPERAIEIGTQIKI
jgi:KUP system potassium uptake protein